MEIILTNLGTTIKQARLSANLTQDELAEQIGITGRYIMALENEHKHPSFEVLCRIILTLNIPADNIFYPESQNTENEKEQLIRLLSRCDERDLKIITATVKAVLESK
ncbi:MAG: helix-turn-helix transcriptional regulator [Oscillibacter sp.]|nr:helix-turn-helix transcriptional regulator [Oscillibacter sp.]